MTLRRGLAHLPAAARRQNPLGALFDGFADHQVLSCEPPDTVVAVGHTIPFVWDGLADSLPSTMAGLMDHAVGNHRDPGTQNKPSALAALVTASHRRRGLSAGSPRPLRSLAEERGMRSLVAPVTQRS